MENEQEKQEKQENKENIKFILTKAKKTGNFLIHRKKELHGQYIHERASYVIHNTHVKFGIEKYNNNNIINTILYVSSNLTYNIIVTLNRIANTFISMGNNKIYAKKYNMENKSFFSFIKDNSNGNKDEQYIVRLYLKHGSKITDKNSNILTYEQIKNKFCNINIELGSLWTNDTTKLYGVNIHATHITVLN